eukprot:TRINITY_DN3222_c0_g1_i1.p1 TRINITY_DN3222_c0_g1~~TRINITY_DN3222_c0_g1_i1.p1  ORF type:complete len:367 (+),score=78.58 TRINITY_DN3222_c0_g1_i1:62-1102(+)
MQEQLRAARDVFKRLGQAEDSLRKQQVTPPPERNIQVLAEQQGWRYLNNDHRLEEGEAGILARPTRLVYEGEGERVEEEDVTPEVTLVLTVQISSGEDVTLVLNPEDSPLRVAEDFITRNGLPRAVIPPLAAKLTTTLQEERAKLKKSQTTPQLPHPSASPKKPAPGAFKTKGRRQPLSNIPPNFAFSAATTTTTTTPAPRTPSPKASPVRGESPVNRIGLKAGQRLYTEGVMHQKATAEQRRRMLDLEEQREAAKSTFSPVISEAARKIRRQDTTYRKRPNPSHVMKQEDQEMQHCTFMPKISSHSDRIMQTRTSPHSAPAYETLYLDAEERLMRVNTDRATCCS